MPIICYSSVKPAGKPVYSRKKEGEEEAEALLFQHVLWTGSYVDHGNGGSDNMELFVRHVSKGGNSA